MTPLDFIFLMHNQNIYDSVDTIGSIGYINSQIYIVDKPDIDLYKKTKVVYIPFTTTEYIIKLNWAS